MTAMNDRKPSYASNPALGGVLARGRSFSPWRGSAQNASVFDAKALVVDADGVSRRFVELALTSTSVADSATAASQQRITVESVRDASGAIEILQSTLVDVIISETELPDMSGLRLLRLLQQESRLRGIPLVFLSADARVETKVVAFRAGIDDYVVKPCNAAELQARISGLIGRQSRIRRAQRDRSYTLGGDFSTLPFPDLVSILELSRRTGVLAVTTSRAVGEVFLEEGRVVHASFGNLTGAAGFHRMVAEASGNFEFTPGELASGAPRTVNESVAALLMEAARLFDHDHRSGTPLSTDASGPDAVVPAARPPQLSREGSLLPSPALASHFESAISDAFAVGELKLWNEQELAKWTRAKLGRDRFHVHLVADMSAGVAALLSMAGPPAERWVREALSPDPKALGLAFFLRYERLFDISLLDAKNAARFVSGLHRRPALTIVAPPDGDALGVGPRALVELETLLRKVTPGVLLWVANTEVPSSIAATVPGACRLSSRGALGDDRHELRGLLARGIRLWGRSSSGPNEPGRTENPA